MMHPVLVTSEAELEQVHRLNLANLKQNKSEAARQQDGFVTWLYTPELLKQMHRLAPSVVVKSGETVVGYALTTLKEAGAFHPDLRNMFGHLDSLQYAGKRLFDHNFYCMGQVCVAEAFRGTGVFTQLYQGHFEYYSPQYDLLVTEISTSNQRSQRAHEKVGFKTIHTYPDHMDEWNVVVWDWRSLKTTTGS